METILEYGQKLSPWATMFACGYGFYALIVKRRELFRGSIYNRKIDELLIIRHKLHCIWMSIDSCHNWSKFSVYKSLLALENDSPEDWETYQNFRKDCGYIFYTFSHENNALLPDWFKPNTHEDLLKSFTEIAPFTLDALSKKNHTDILDFQNFLFYKFHLF